MRYATVYCRLRGTPLSIPSAKRLCTTAARAKPAAPILSKGFFPRSNQVWTPELLDARLSKWGDQASKTELLSTMPEGTVLWEGLRKLFTARWLGKEDIGRGAMFPSDIVFVEKLKNRFLLYANDCTPDVDPEKGFCIRKLVRFAYGSTENPRPEYELNRAISNALQIDENHPVWKSTDWGEELRNYDLKAIAQEHREILRQPGNNPLQQYLVADEKFRAAIVRALYAVRKAEEDAAEGSPFVWQQLLVAFNEDPFFQAWAPNLTEAEIIPSEPENPPPFVTPYLWDDGNCEALSSEELSFRISSPNNGSKDNANEDDVEEEIIDDDTSDEQNEELLDPFTRNAQDHFVSNVPPQFLAHPDLLHHTLNDCPKLAALDPKDLAQGYSGELGHFRYGLWEATGLPVVMLRPHLLELRDLLMNKKDGSHLGRYIEVVGDFGTGKSVAIMYAAAVARKLGWLTIYLPDAHKWIEDIGNPIPSNAIEAVFFQHDYARVFFANLLLTEEERLDQIPLRQAYTKPSNWNDGSNNSELGMATLRQIMDDPGGVEKYENEILEQWFRRGDGDHRFLVEDGEDGMSLGDMVRHGADKKECPAPAALLYEFLEELRLQEELDILVAADGVNLWDEPVRGLCTPRYPVVYGFQLSMVDCFSQFQRINAMPRVTSVYCNTSHLRKGRASRERSPSDVILVPGVYEPQEFDCIVWAYQALGLSSKQVGRDDCLKIEGSSGRMPRYVQRTAALY